MLDQLEGRIINILKTKQNVACLKLFNKRGPKWVYAFIFFCPVSHEFFFNRLFLKPIFYSTARILQRLWLLKSNSTIYIKRDDVLNVSVFLLHILSLVQVKKYLKLCHFIANLMLWYRLLNFKVLKWYIFMRIIYMIRY